jgi:hypothetical protein
MKRFCIDNKSDPDLVRQAVVDLKRTVRLGKRAEKVLQALKQDGHFDGDVPIVAKNGYLGYVASVHKFPAYQPISRDDIPGWSEISVECDERRTGEHGGSKFYTMPVFLRGQALYAQLDDDNMLTGKIAQKLQKLKIASARLGECRLKSNGTVTFAVSDRYYCGAVFRVRRNINASANAKADAKAFASILAQALVQFDDRDWHAKARTPQKLLDLRQTVPSWLIEDGHVERMFNDMLDAIEIVNVMGV